MKKFMSLVAMVAVIGLLCMVCLFSTSVLAQGVNIDAKATGEFGGHPDVSVPTVLDMVPGFVFSGPGTIRITASRTIDLTPNLAFPVGQNVPPDGQVPLDRVTVLGAADRYMPLEEALVDAGGVLPSNFLNGGALMGAFVPQAIVDTPGFLAKDDDFLNGGISSDRLFFIGSGPFDFTTTIPGTLFLGINDIRATNNSGSFEVTMRVVWRVDDGGNGHLYAAILVPAGIDWTDAEAAARAMGPNWHLAAITSQEENDFVFSLISGNLDFWICCSSGNSAGPWLGGVNIGPGVEDYEWVTGEPFVYTNWGALEPFGNGERIALFGFQAPEGDTWNDIGPDRIANGYIAESFPLPVCDVQLSQTVYFDGETVTAEVLRLANSHDAPIAIEIKTWLETPGAATLPHINTGAGGSIILPPGLDVDLGPFPTLRVNPAHVAGGYEFNCRLLDPVTGETLTLDVNPFEIQ